MTRTRPLDYADCEIDGGPEVDPCAFALTVTLSIAGILTNAGGAWVIYRKEAMHNGFGVLSFSHIVADFFTCAIALGWCAPTVLFIGYEFDASWLGYVICMFAQVFYYGAIYVHVAKSINRLVAICQPGFYHVHFTTARTVKVAVGLWVVTFFQCTVFLFGGCHIWFDVRTYIWYYEETPCGDNMWFYVDTVFDYCLIAVIVLCDAVTLFNIHKHRRRIDCTRKREFVQGSMSGTDSYTSLITRDRFWCDVRFFAQGALFAIVYASLIFTSHYNGDHDHWLLRLFFGSLIWIIAAIAGGLVVIIFNISLK